MTTDVQSAELVRLTIRGAIAVLTIDNPPVNALRHGVREALMAMLERCLADESIEGLVIACAGSTFVAGADISEFGKPQLAPTLRQVLAVLDGSPKPSVAAVHGTALGGGLELALACHFRVASATARLGLPEVKLGLVPGSGGTVRLPYLIGAEAALTMIVQGEPISAAEALDAGLVDGVYAADLVDSAVAFLKEKLAGDAPAIPVSQRRDKIDAADLAALDAQIAVLGKKGRGLDAPVAAAQTVRNAVILPFDAALAAERVAFEALMAGSQSQAQRHLFFAERAALKIEGVDKSVMAREIATAGVIGAGTMGGGIAMALLNRGLPVLLLDVDDAALARGRASIEKNYALSIARGSLQQTAVAERLARLKTSTNFDDLAQCDLVIEAAFEDMAVKQSIFRRLEKIARPGAILATNTSYLDVNQIAAATNRPGDVIGLHFFSPANVMKLVEIVRAQDTAPDVLASALKLAKRIAKVPVVVGVCQGFVGNRMLGARSADMFDLLLEGASPEAVDKAFTDFGWPMGPFQMQDLAGLDIGWRNRKSLGQTQIIADDLCERGRFGQKTGMGYYLYEQGSRVPKVDPEIGRLIEAKARQLGIERRTIAPEEIVERTLYPLINEGTAILQEAIAARSSDIDLVWVHGYGFPVGKGGPMFWAEQFGWAKLIERLEFWHGRTGKAIFLPTERLRTLAAARTGVV